MDTIEQDTSILHQRKSFEVGVRLLDVQTVFIVSSVEIRYRGKSVYVRS
jgi:hypothetical protein